MAAKKVTLEDSFERLDEILESLKSGDLTLEESFKKYEEGMRIVKKCQDMVDKAEKKLIVIENGSEKDEE